MQHTLSVTYSSWPLEWPNGNTSLSTLAVFYDKVLLPYPYFFDEAAPVFWTNSGKSLIAKDLQDDFAEWKRSMRPLLDAKLVEFLPPPFVKPEEFPSMFTKEVRARINALRQGGKLPKGTLFTSFDGFTGTFTFALHALYGSKPAPELFISNPSDKATDRLAAYLVQTLFRFQVPRVADLHPDEILEVRAYLKDSKEGFVDLMFELTDDIESRLRSGDSSELAAATKTVERKLLPKYREFRRQLNAKKMGFWSKVLARGAKFLQIDAAPWTPKFYGSILEGLFGTLDDAAQDDEKRYTREGQAFQYLARLEERAGPSGA
jgi:hypothetical protein